MIDQSPPLSGLWNRHHGRRISHRLTLEDAQEIRIWRTYHRELTAAACAHQLKGVYRTSVRAILDVLAGETWPDGQSGVD